MSDAPPIGIDLGTTHSVVAVFAEHGPQVIPSVFGEPLVPSELALDDEDHLLVGAPARAVGLRRPDRHAARFKPDMGTDRELTLGSMTLSPVSASALVLRELKDTAELHLGHPVERAVISVPAWFREPQRRATLDAGQLAGLEVQRLINEPTAAALAHGLEGDDELRRVAVLDLGGGTFDVTLLELFDGVVDVRASVGDVHLGGEDVTDAVGAWLGRQSKVRTIDPAITGRLRHAAERAKRVLSSEPVASVEGIEGQRVELDRATLRGLCQPLIDRMRVIVEQALLQAELGPERFDEVLLVGGAVRMPFIGEAATEWFGQAPRPLGAVDHLVALGAAVQAALVADHAAVRERLVTDVLTHSLGLAAQRTFDDRVYADRFVPLLSRGVTLPASRSDTFSTVRHDQDVVQLEIYEGERRIASDNHHLGTLKLEVPPGTEAEHREAVDVRFTHDASGLLEVEATVRSSGTTQAILIERGGQAYDEDDRSAFVAQMAQLKVHPRDLLPNRWLLERATNVVERLTGDRRAELDTFLMAFEAALDEGDPERIEALRTGLGARVAELERVLHLDLPQ